MASNRTVPTRIVNKNGVSTTVHKRVDNLSAARKDIPAVAAPGSEKKVSELDQLKDLPFMSAYTLWMTMSRNKQRISRKMRDEMLSDIHPETMERIDHILRESPDHTVPMYSALIDHCMHKRSMEDLNNLAVAADVVLEADDVHQRVFHTYLTGIQMYRYQTDPYFDFSKASEHEQEGVRALLRVSMNVGREYVAPNTFVDGTPRHIVKEYEGLYNLCFRRPKDAEKIIHLLNTRHMPIQTEQDIQAIEALLEQDTESSLMGGVL